MINLLKKLIFAKEEPKQDHRTHDTLRKSSEEQWERFDAYMRGTRWLKITMTK